MDDVADNRVETTRVATARGAILFDRCTLAQAGDALFDPACWAERRAVSSRGGRGTVWFLRGDSGAAVLRHYHRGGMVGRINRDRYLWSGEDAVRSFREFSLLAELRARGLPVPAPFAARYARRGVSYRADILVGLVADSQTLAEGLSKVIDRAGFWRGLGRTIARFHRQGVFHADLNAHNILIDREDAVWLIDFDRGAIRTDAAPWREANLQRLRRSLTKLGAAAHARWSEAWDALRSGYDDSSSLPARGTGEVA